MTSSIAITGAGRGIGAALAIHYAAPGRALLLIGRDRPRLDAVAQQCRARGADVTVASADVTDAASLSRVLEAADDAAPIDILIANAGVSTGPGADGGLEPAEAAARTIRVNLEGVLNTVAPVAGRMRARGAGRIGLVSSLAALLPLPDSPAYCASKAGVVAYGLSLDAALRPHGVSVSVLCPGFVRTDMSDRYLGAKPFMMAPERAAAIIAAAIERRARLHAFPRQMAALMRGAKLIPAPLRIAAMDRFRFAIAPEE